MQLKKFIKVYIVILLLLQQIESTKKPTEKTLQAAFAENSKTSIKDRKKTAIDELEKEMKRSTNSSQSKAKFE